MSDALARSIGADIGGARTPAPLRGRSLLAPLADYPRVLWRPLATLRRARSGQEVATLLLAIVATDFILSLLLLPTFLRIVSKAVPAGQADAVSIKVGALGTAVVMSSSINTVIVCCVAVLMLIGLYVAGANVRFRNILAVLMLSSFPLVIDRVVRLSLSVVVPGRSAAATLLPLSTLVHAAPGSELARALGFFSLFDVWTFALVLLGAGLLPGVRPLPARLLAVLFWGGLQLLLLRLFLAGLLGG